MDRGVDVVSISDFEVKQPGHMERLAVVYKSHSLQGTFAWCSVRQ